MKYFLATLVLLFAITTSFAQQKAKIGMTMAEVKKIYPDMQSFTNGNEITLERQENLYGINATWGYRFKGDKLTWIFFMKYIREINDTNFNKCLSATKLLIKDYTAAYGKPDTTITGNTKFIDPYKQLHWGYNVMEVRWKNYDGMKIKIEFNFMGGKGEYAFLVLINYFDKDYPYYD